MTSEQLDALERLAKLKEQGLLTEQELETAKASIIYSAMPPPASAAPTSQPEQHTPLPAATSAPVAMGEPTSAGGSTAKVLVIAAALIAVFVLMVRFLISSPKTEATGVAGIDTAAVSAALDTSSLPAPPPGPPPTKWSYYENDDAMDGKYYTASIDADDLLNFDFPYSGGSTATVTIRKKRGGTDVYLRVSKGQFNSTYDGGRVRVKFDNGPTETYSFVGASDGSSDIIFFEGVKRLVAKMKRSERMIVEAEFYNNGLRKMTFQTEGLKWNR